MHILKICLNIMHEYCIIMQSEACAVRRRQDVAVWFISRYWLYSAGATPKNRAFSVRIHDSAERNYGGQREKICAAARCVV